MSPIWNIGAHRAFSYFTAPDMFRAKLKLSNCYSWEHLVVLQNKLHMCHVCHTVNKKHTTSRILQKVPFQISPPRPAGITSVQDFGSLRISSWLAAIFQNGRNFSSIPVCAWAVSGFSVLLKSALTTSSELTIWKLGKLCISHIDMIFNALSSPPQAFLFPFLPDPPQVCVFIFLLLS